METVENSYQTGYKALKAAVSASPLVDFRRRARDVLVTLILPPYFQRPASVGDELLSKKEFTLKGKNLPLEELVISFQSEILLIGEPN